MSASPPAPPSLRQAQPPASLDDLRVLVAVVDEGNLSAAGRRLRLPKQSVSRRLAALEEQLGLQLIERSPQSCRPTVEGALLAERARRPLVEAEEALRRAGSEELAGRLRLTSPRMVAEELAPQALLDSLAARPGLCLDLHLGEERLDLHQHGLDAALRVGRLPDSSLRARRLGPARIALACSPVFLDQHGPIHDPAQLAELPCLVHPVGEGEDRWPLLDAEGRLQLWPLATRLRCPSHPLLLAAARRHLGLCLLPEPSLREDLRSGRLVSVLESRLPVLGAVWLLRPDGEVGPRLQGLLSAWLPALERSLEGGG